MIILCSIITSVYFNYCKSYMKFVDPSLSTFVFAGSRPIAQPPPRSVTGCQRSFCLSSSLRSPSQAAAAVDRALPIARPSDKVAYTAWKEWSKFGRATVVYGGQANRLHQPTRRHRAQREPLASRVGDYWASVAGRNGTAAPRAGRGRAPSSPG